MSELKILEQITATVTQLMPHMPAELKRNMRAALQSALERNNLVTREELEVQEAVLVRTRARLEGLEKQVAKLEEQLRKK